MKNKDKIRGSRNRKNRTFREKYSLWSLFWWKHFFPPISSLLLFWSKKIEEREDFFLLETFSRITSQFFRTQTRENKRNGLKESFFCKSLTFFPSLSSTLLFLKTLFAEKKEKTAKRGGKGFRSHTYNRLGLPFLLCKREDSFYWFFPWLQFLPSLFFSFCDSPHHHQRLPSAWLTLTEYKKEQREGVMKKITKKINE